MSDIISAPITILNEVISSPVVTASDVVNSSTQELANSTISTPVAVTEDVVNSPIQEAMNAYQLAVAAGYVGTLQEFLNGRISADATLSDNPTFAPSQGATKTYIDAAIADEATARTDTDTTLAAAIASEATARASADTVLATSIASEAATRTSADTALATSIASEATARASADAALAASISSEAATRTSAVTTLTNSITSEATARTSAVTTLTNSITSEATTRSAADTTLTNSITSEATARANADTALAGEVALKAPLASPTFSGSPTTPTPTSPNNDLAIANVKYVNDALASVPAPPMVIVSDTPPSAPEEGWKWFDTESAIESIYYNGYWVSTKEPVAYATDGGTNATEVTAILRDDTSSKLLPTDNDFFTLINSADPNLMTRVSAAGLRKWMGRYTQFGRDLFRNSFTNNFGASTSVPRNNANFGVLDGYITPAQAVAGHYIRFGLLNSNGSLDSLAAQNLVSFTRPWTLYVKVALTMPNNLHFLLGIGAEASGGVPSSRNVVGIQFTSATTARLWRNNGSIETYSDEGTLTNIQTVQDNPSHFHHLWLECLGNGTVELYVDSNPVGAGPLPRPDSPLCSLSGCPAAASGGNSIYANLRVTGLMSGSVRGVMHLADARFIEM